MLIRYHYILKLVQVLSLYMKAGASSSKKIYSHHQENVHHPILDLLKMVLGFDSRGPANSNEGVTTNTVSSRTGHVA
jgi:hypothetical protein